MGMGITVSGATRMLFDAPSTRSSLYRKGSSHVVTTGKSSKKSKTKGKKYKYNYKSLSGSIVRAKTPTGAQKAIIQAKQALARVMRQARLEDMDDEDLERTVLHIKRMEIIARRKKKHLEQEEKAEQDKDPGEGIIDPREDPRDIFAELKDGMSDNGEEELTEDQLKLIEKLTEEISKMEEEMFESDMEELMGADTISMKNMTPEEIETMKKKHRCAEQKDITLADMEYLRSVFDQLEREKSSGGTVLSGGSTDQVFFELQESSCFTFDAFVDVQA